MAPAYTGQLPNHDDDWCGIFIEPLEIVTGLNSYSQFVWSTNGDSKRNKPGDLDVCLWSLSKWAKLASKGNPTALSYLYATNVIENKLWRKIQASGNVFLATSHANAFIGFAKSQLDRLLGLRGEGKHGQRPEMSDQYGWDVKAGMHVIRLLNEGIELMETGIISYPRPEKDLLISIRTGNCKLDDIISMADSLFIRLSETSKKSFLPSVVDMKAVSKLISEIYGEHWNQSNDVVSVLAKAVSVASYWISQNYKGKGSWVGNPKAVEKDLIALAFEFYNEENKQKNGAG